MITSLSAVLDRLSSEIDPGGHERRRYEREEGAVLSHAAAISMDALRQSGFTPASFDLFGLDGTGFVMSHDSSEQMVGHLHLSVDRKNLRVWFEPKGNFTSRMVGQPSMVPLESITDNGILEAIAEQVGRVQFSGYPS